MSRQLCLTTSLLYFLESQVLEKQSCTEHFDKFVQNQVLALYLSDNCFL